jgi:hypothetical protein
VQAGVAFPTGPPDGYAGNPPLYRTCTDCHGFAQGDGNLALLDLPLPSGYSAGATYDLRVELADTGQQRWGFEVTVLDGAGQQAGTLIASDPLFTQLSDRPAPDPDYLKQTLEGTFWGVPDGPVTWTFQWIAPASGGDVTFYLAGNAANGNNRNTGDFVYALVIPVGSTVAVSELTTSPSAIVALEPGFPNPFASSTRIAYQLAEASPVSLRIYDLSGRLILSLVDRALPAGRHVVRWDGQDRSGRRVASGAYLIALSAGDARVSRRVVFQR